MLADSAKYAGYDALLFVENFIRKNGGECTREEIQKKCGSIVDILTFEEIFTYLTESGKIAEDAGGKICWIYNPELVKKYQSRDDLRVL